MSTEAKLRSWAADQSEETDRSNQAQDRRRQEDPTTDEGRSPADEAGRGRSTVKGALLDIAVVILISAAAFVLEGYLRDAGLLPLGEDSRGVLAVVIGALASLAVVTLRGETFRDLGFRRPRRLWTVPLWMVGIFAVYILAQGLSVTVLSQFFEIPQPDLSRYDMYRGSLSAALFFALVLPFTASIPEEIIYRGFLMGRLQRIFGAGFSGDAATVAVQACIFGAIHFQWGFGGVLFTVVMGLVWGTSFLLCGRNLWIVIAAHSFGHVMLALQLYLTPPA